MGFDDRYRLSAHAVIIDEAGRVLLLQATYGDRRWGLPGGAVDPGETLHETVVRECKEELGCEVQVKYLSGIYYHPHLEVHVAVFRCSLPIGAEIRAEFGALAVSLCGHDRTGRNSAEARRRLLELLWRGYHAPVLRPATLNFNELNRA